MSDIVYVAIISTIGGLIGLYLYSRQSVINWSLKMDYMQQTLNHKMKIEQIRARKQIEKAKLKNESRGLDLNNIDLDQVGDIVDSLSGGEGSGLSGILNNPIVKGLLRGAGGGSQEQKQLPPEFEGAEFEE